MKFYSNRQLAKLLKEISAAYTVKNADFFKITAYQKAADSAEHSTSQLQDLWKEGKLGSVSGLGKNIQSYLEELFKTGRVRHFESIKKDLPPGMFNLLGIGGIGAKSAYKLASGLNLKNIKDLENAAKNKKIRNVEGFGQKSEEEIIAALSEFKNKSNRYLLPFAAETTEKVINYLKQSPVCEEAQPLGSLRRKVATIGDIDIGVASKNAKTIISHFKKYPDISRLLGAGSVSASAILKNGIQVDLKVQLPKAFGALLQHFTGSKSHNIHLREIAQKQKLSLSEHGVKIKGKLTYFSNEKDFYNKLGLAYIEPELRENTGEVEAAFLSAQGKPNGLPNLITQKDIKGDLHLHSNYPIESSHDAGENSFEEIINKAKKLNYEYIGLSDHSPATSTHTKKQIIDIIKERKKVIEQIKHSEKSISILNLLEIDILSGGDLSVPVEGLKLLDFAIAGIHSGHNQDKSTITNRLLTACKSPYVKIISHPTGRLLDGRNSYDADWPKIFEACAKTRTFLEINAWPNRLDLPDTLIREAIKYKVKLIINSDAHEISQMDNMKFGVVTAKRGWAQRQDIANTLSRLEFYKLIGV